MRMMTTHNSKRRKILHSFYISVILCMIFSCGGHRYPQQMLTADSLTEVNPDSAVALLRQLSPQMQHERKAVRMYHRLLTVKAADKADQLQPVPDSILPIVKYYERRGNKRQLPTAYYYAGRTYYELHDAPQALDYFQKAAEVAGEDWNLEGCIYSNIGYLFLYQGLYNEMKDAFTKMYEISRQHNDTIGMIQGLKDISTSLEAEDKHKEALHHLLKAYELAQQTHSQMLVNSVEVSLSGQYMFMGNYVEALKHARISLEHLNTMDSSAVYSLVAAIYKKMGNEDSLLYYSQKIEQVGHIHAKDSAYKFMSKIYLRRGNVKEANKYFDKYLLMDDSLREITKTEATKKVHSLYNYQLREKENEKLKKKNRNSVLLMVLMFFTSSMIIIVLVGYQNHLRKKHVRETLMLKYAEYLKEKKLQDSELQLQSNNERIRFLERELEKEKQKLLSEDIISQTSPTRNADVNTTVRNTLIYQKFIKMADGNSRQHPTDEDWHELEGLLSTVYDQFPIRLKIVCNLSKRDYQMCLLIKIKMRPQEIANIFSIEKSSVSSQRARLYKDHFGEKKKAKAWDEYILSL